MISMLPICRPGRSGAGRRPAPTDGFVRVRGARENNLRNVDVDVPRDAIVAFTGVSGSGKSSLAFGTIYAEAQRRYFESVAPYARRLIQQGHNPKVEMITGLPPAVALQQRRGTPSSRSTVGTVTTLSNSLRMLFSRAGSYPDGASQLDSDAFSPNTAAGACPECHGLGIAHTVTESSLVPDTSLSIRDGAIAAWPGRLAGQEPARHPDPPGLRRRHPLAEAAQKGPRLDPLHRGTARGGGDAPARPGRQAVQGPLLERQELRAAHPRRFQEHHHARAGAALHGNRPLPGLRRQRPDPGRAGRDVRRPHHRRAQRRAHDANWPRSSAPPPSSRRPGPPRASRRSGEGNEVAVAITRDLLQRVTVLLDLGLGYLALGRSTPTLSPGEMQRLRIATQLRSGLFGVIYVLDEPSAGLHPADAEPLLAVLDQLKSSGNSVFVVEHNMDIVRRADWLVDVGPRAGEGGGEVLYSGPVAGLAEVDASVTRPFLFPDGSGAVGRRSAHDSDGRRRRLRRQPAPAGKLPAGWSCATSAATTCANSTPTSRSAC